jgi:hypothetical protein
MPDFTGDRPMTTRTSLCSAALGIVLSGCAWLHGGPYPGAAPAAYDTPRCDQSPCRVSVHVSDCRISVSPERLGVRKGLRRATIEWRIEDRGYTFARDGIVFADKEAARTFHAARMTAHDTFTVVDENTGPGEYKYTVRVERDGKACEPLDPVVINDM